MAVRQAIEVRRFKWPRCRTAVAVAQLLGEDAFGPWLGVTRVLSVELLQLDGRTALT